MLLRHIALGLLVAITWGLNFVLSKICLTEISPLLLSASRFFFTSMPAIFFIKKPKVAIHKTFLYGMLAFAIPNIFMLYGIHNGVTAGIASLLMQLQGILTVLFGILFFHERLKHIQYLGIAFACSGLIWIGYHTDGKVSLLGCLFLVIAATSLSAGNVLSKQLGKTVDRLSLVIWASFLTWPVLGLITYLVEGSAKMTHTIQSVSLLPTLALLLIAYVGTVFGFGAWVFLLHNYPLSSVAPFTLLVPVVGFLGSVILLNEQMFLWKIIALALVGTGLLINISSMRKKS